MAVLTESQLEDIDCIIENMTYKVNGELDPWYPTMEEIREKLHGKSRNEVLFLMWLTVPENPLTPEQTEVKRKIHKMLYSPDFLTIKPDPVQESTKGE